MKLLIQKLSRRRGPVAATLLLLSLMAVDVMARSLRRGDGGGRASVSRSSASRSSTTRSFSGFSHGVGNVSKSSGSKFSKGQSNSGLSVGHLGGGLSARSGLDRPGVGKPGVGVGKPGVGVGKPGVGVGKPGVGVGKPGVGVGKPGVGVGKPGVGIGKPGVGIGKVEIGKVKVGVGVVRPGFGRPGYRPGPRYPPCSWHAHRRYAYNSWIDDRWDHWEDYWRWRAVAGAIRLGAYYLTRPPYYTPIYRNGAYYYYADGVWYRLINGVYTVVAAPNGAVVATAPPTYQSVPVEVNSSSTDSNNTTTNYYYYANGTFYQETTEPTSTPTTAQTQAADADRESASQAVSAEQKQSAQTYQKPPADSGDGTDQPAEPTEPKELTEDPDPGTNYVITAPPVGASVSVLPADAKEQKIGDTTYYSHAGAWYQAFYSGSTTVYMVVKKPEGASS